MSRPLPAKDWFSKAIDRLTPMVGQLRCQTVNGPTVPRFVEKTAARAVFLKTACYVSGLNAGRLLLEYGYVQECCVIQRTLDEIHEDILFLSLPKPGATATKDHSRYLSSFWEEEPDFKTFSGRQRNRDAVPRKKIRAFLSKSTETGQTDHTGITTSAYLARLYSGYVHAAAPQVLEQFDPNSNTFETEGISDPSLRNAHSNDFENQIFRGVIGVYFCARLLKNPKVSQEAFDLLRRLEDHFAD